MPSSRQFFWLDVFTDLAFAGNPLGVFPDGSGLSTAQMQTLARELNLSETTFVLAPQRLGATHKVRIFTPTFEMPFAGHPTIGTALVIADQMGGATSLVLDELVGNVAVSIEGGGAAPRMATLTTAAPPTARPPSLEYTPAVVCASLHINNEDLADEPMLTIDSGPSFLAVPVRSIEVLSRVRCADPAFGFVGFYVFAPRSDGGWQARMFFEANGVVEDPATGSAACAFAGWLQATGRLSEGTNRIEIAQGVEMGRPSVLHLEADLVDGTLQPVRLRGSAVVIAQGHMIVPEPSDV